MTLTDAGPLVALINAGDQHHSACAAAYRQLATPLLTTWPCLAEAMHLLQRYGGYRYQAALWSMHFRGQLALHQLTRAETARVAELMEQYRDTPMDLADASLVAVAESRSLRLAFTVDRQFYISGLMTVRRWMLCRRRAAGTIPIPGTGSGPGPPGRNRPR